MDNKQQLTDTQIQEVFQQLGLSGHSTPLAGQSQAPLPSSPPLYFPLSADSLSTKKGD
jgi:hypothetical protein